MKGILIAAHGSRQKSTEQTLAAIAAMTKEILRGAGQDMPTQIAFMEFGSPTIPEGLDALVRQGAREIVVAPYFLFDGIHIREDIPELLAAYERDHAGVKLTLAAPLGEDERLARVLADRILGAKN